MSSWMTHREIAEAKLPSMPTNKAGVQRLAESEDWLSRRDRNGRPLWRERAGRGGGKEWHVSLLPVLAQKTLSKRSAHGADLTSTEALCVRLTALEAEMRAVRKAVKDLTGGQS